MLKDYVLIASESGQADAEFVAGFWDDRWRAHMQSASHAQRIRHADEYQFLEDEVPGLASKSLDILDCGCGLGQWTLMFAAQRHRVLGLDIAKEAIARLRDQYGNLFRLGDFRHIACEDNSYDLVINWGGIEHFEEGPVPAIREALRILRPGGLFVATTPCHNFRLFLLDALLGRWTGPQYPLDGYRFYQYRFSQTELVGYFRACGFQHVRSRIINGAQGVSRSLDHELRWFGRWLPSLVRKGLMMSGGLLLRPFLGHMVICGGRKPSEE